MCTLYSVACLCHLACRVCVFLLQKMCQQYWPAQTNVTETIGSKFNITVTLFLPSAEYQIRKMQLRLVSVPLSLVLLSLYLLYSVFVHRESVKNWVIMVVKTETYSLISQTSELEQERTVTHMLYTAWPDHGVPRNAMSLISFIRRVRKEHPTSLAIPLLVHCSAGVGRTGTFILLDLAIQQMKRERTLSVFSHLQNMRNQRMKMFQSLVSAGRARVEPLSEYTPEKTIFPQNSSL